MPAPRPTLIKQPKGTKWIKSLAGKILHRRESFFALSEQAMISGINFLFTLMLLGFAPLETLGIFQMGRFLMLLLAGIQNSLISFPYTIAFRQLDAGGPTASKHYALSQFILALMFSVLTVLLISISLLLPWDPSVFWMLLALLSAAPMFLIREFSRRHEFAHLRTQSAMWFSGVAAILQVGGLVTLHLFGEINAASSMTVLALAYALTNLIWFLLRRKEFPIAWAFTHASRWTIAKTLKDNWRIGRWIFSSQSLSDALLTSVQWLITLGVDKSAGGAFAACFQVASLLNPLVMGLTNLLPPRFAKILAEENQQRLYQAAWTSARSMLIVLVLTSVLLCVFSPWLLEMLANQPIANATFIMLMLVTMMDVQALSIPPFHGLNALSLPQKTVAPQAIGLAAGVLIFLLLGATWGAMGAALALLVGRALVTGIIFWEFRRWANVC